MNTKATIDRLKDTIAQRIFLLTQSSKMAKFNQKPKHKAQSTVHTMNIDLYMFHQVNLYYRLHYVGLCMDWSE